MDASRFLVLYLAFNSEDMLICSSPRCSLNLFRGINFVQTHTHTQSSFFLNVTHKMISINKRLMIELGTGWCICACFYVKFMAHHKSYTPIYFFPTHSRIFRAFFSLLCHKIQFKDTHCSYYLYKYCIKNIFQTK